MASRIGWICLSFVGFGAYSRWRAGIQSPLDLYLQEHVLTVPVWIAVGSILVSMWVWLFVVACRLYRAKRHLAALRAKRSFTHTDDVC